MYLLCVGWLVVLGFNTTLTAQVILWRSVTHVFPASANTTFLSKAPDYFPAEVRGDNTPGKKVCLNRVSNSKPPGHESDTLTTEPPVRGLLCVPIQCMLDFSSAMALN